MASRGTKKPTNADLQKKIDKKNEEIQQMKDAMQSISVKLQVMTSAYNTLRNIVTNAHTEVNMAHGVLVNALTPKPQPPQENPEK